MGTIGPDTLLSFVHTDELNGEDSVNITTTYPIMQGYRLVWQDRNGIAHEHVCQDPKGLHADEETIYTDTALNSICETYGDYIEDKRPYRYDYLKALQTALSPTRWEVGTVDQPGAVSSGLTFYHTTAREAIQDILECGGELETTIEVDGTGVTTRKVNIRAHRGNSSGHRRFSYTKDITSISRTESSGAITACYGYGKGVETGNGGYGRKLTFGAINDGKDYVVDESALVIYGRPDGNGGYAHVFGIYENSDCESATQLLSETKSYLAEHNAPGVSYEADVVDLVQFGRDWEGVSVGDDVQIVDTAFTPALRCKGRVSKLVTDVLGGTQTVTLGNIVETIADMFTAQQQTVNNLSRRSADWDVAASTPVSYLEQVVSGLNERFNTSGMSYTYTSFEHGTTWASVPMDADGKPTSAGGTAIQISSQGLRIASGTLADGSWDWRTFGTGEGFTADLITAGSINADLITSGTYSIKDSGGNIIVQMGNSIPNGLQVYDPYTKAVSQLSWTAFRPWQYTKFSSKNTVSLSMYAYPSSPGGLYPYSKSNEVAHLSDIPSSDRTFYVGENGGAMLMLFGQETGSSSTSIKAKNADSGQNLRSIIFAYYNTTIWAKQVGTSSYGTAFSTEEHFFPRDTRCVFLKTGESISWSSETQKDGVILQLLLTGYDAGAQCEITGLKTTLYYGGGFLHKVTGTEYLDTSGTKGTLKASVQFTGIIIIPF